MAGYQSDTREKGEREARITSKKVKKKVKKKIEEMMQKADPVSNAQKSAQPTHPFHTTKRNQLRCFIHQRGV
jgi:hypothetical protein